ncbi:MAG: LysR family transcriptional regulator [Clostridia bacterium]|nr:LysR family transcriptional regulator [Clostridia bacterium]
MLDLYELEQLTAFAELGTLSRVAEAFHISTPSVTRAMQNLEDSFGVPLFTRSKNKIELNENGQAAVELAGKLLQEAEEAVRRIRALDARRKSLVVKSCAPAPLWKLMKRLSESHPGLTVSSSICQNEEALSAWENGDCDVVILPFPISAGKGKTEKWMEEHLYICVPPEHALSGCREVTFAEINGFNFLLRTELGFWDMLCRQKMPASKFLVQADDFTFQELVRSSSLPCFTTDYDNANRRAAEYGRVSIPITDSEANVTFYIARKPCRQIHG